MTPETVHALEKYAQHLAQLFDTNCRIVDIHSQSFVSRLFGEAPYFLPHCPNTRCNVLNTYLYGCSEAYRWNGRYIFYCPEGFVFIASSVSDSTGALSGGMMLGPIVMGNGEDTLEHYRGRPEEPAVWKLSQIPTEKVNHIAEIMARITESVSGRAHSLAGNISYKQEDILQSLYSQREALEQQGGPPYPVEAERQLQRCIRLGDKQGAQEILNELLAQIYFFSQYDMDTIKIRVIELLTLLSRATIDAGADRDEIIWFNTGCVREMQGCEDVEELSVWVTGILHRFVRYSFDFSTLKHSNTVHLVMEYIRENYRMKISLEDVARYVNFSKAYLSRIFKEETGENLSAYINRVRVEKAKLFLGDKNIKLIEVANLVGFEDQSYFTKVFKAATGTSPKKYKEGRNAAREG